MWKTLRTVKQHIKNILVIVRFARYLDSKKKIFSKIYVCFCCLKSQLIIWNRKLSPNNCITYTYNTLFIYVFVSIACKKNIEVNQFNFGHLLQNIHCREFSLKNISSAQNNYRNSLRKIKKYFEHVLYIEALWGQSDWYTHNTIVWLHKYVRMCINLPRHKLFAFMHFVHFQNITSREDRRIPQENCFKSDRM